jgi:60 kDa SS-A/Ro ribonucleoprotein
MSRSYLTRAASPLATPQHEPIPGTAQVKNAAGGFAWKVGSMDRLRRFLILGSEGGSYYASERDLTRQNIDGVRAALDEHKTEAVAEIVAISKDGRAAKNDPALYALAIACAHPDEQVRRAAAAAIPAVARTGTHLFHFAEFVETQRGWGPALSKGVAAWYEREDVGALAYQLVKYRQRDGWTHRDLLRLAHPSAPSNTHRLLFDWLCGRNPEVVPDLPSAVAYARAQTAATPRETAALIAQFEGALPREALNTEHLNAPEVWTAMLKAGMPMTALIRNLATMTRIGVLKPMGDATKIVTDQLANPEAIRKARVHPLPVLGALVTYASGRSARGTNSWDPLSEIVDALDGAFYLAFGNVAPTGKRTLLGLDVSGSMAGPELGGMPGVTPRVGSAAMALVTAAVEPHYHVMAFSRQFVPVAISPRERLDDVLRTVDPLPFGRTDCALPMLYAMEKGIDVDTFVIYTDSETWCGQVHPVQALEAYRRKTGIPARLVVVGMVSNGFTIADRNDQGMLDVVGFDTAAPQVIADFSAARW